MRWGVTSEIREHCCFQSKSRKYTNAFTATANTVKKNMNYRNGWKMFSYKCGSYLVVFMSLSISLTSAFLPNEINEIDVSFTALDSTQSNRKGKCKYLSWFLLSLWFFDGFFFSCVYSNQKKVLLFQPNIASVEIN